MSQKAAAKVANAKWDCDATAVVYEVWLANGGKISKKAMHDYLPHTLRSSFTPEQLESKLKNCAKLFKQCKEQGWDRSALGIGFIVFLTSVVLIVCFVIIL